MGLVGAILTFALADSLSVVLFKDVFERLRPCHNPEFDGIIHLLEYKGGYFGFVSSHAANVFALATFTLLYLKKRLYTILIIVWATLVSYSRIYVGKHYPGDVICGALFGILIALIIFYIFQKVVKCSVSSTKSPTHI